MQINNLGRAGCGKRKPGVGKDGTGIIGGQKRQWGRLANSALEIEAIGSNVVEKEKLHGKKCALFTYRRLCQFA